MRPIEKSANTTSRFEPRPLASIANLPSYPWFVVGTVCIGAFMGQLDASIAQLVLPTLQARFSVSLAAVSWVALGIRCDRTPAATLEAILR